MCLLADFRARYPAVPIDAGLTMTTHDVVAEGFDFAIRMVRALEPNLIARPLGMAREAIEASPAYLAKHSPDGVNGTLPVRDELAIHQSMLD